MGLIIRKKCWHCDTVVEQTIQNRGNDHRVMEHFRPIRKGLVRSDYGTDLFIAVGNEAKEQIAFLTAYRRVAGFVPLNGDLRRFPPVAMIA
jgi:hypothetical protein